MTQANSTTATLNLIVTLDRMHWINNGKTCSVLNATWAGRHLSKAGNQSWTLIYCRQNITSKDYIEKLPQKITRDDHTIAEAEWRMSYLHFLHFPSTKTTLQSAHVGKNGWNVSKCTSPLMMWKTQHARERYYYTPLVKRWATYLKHFQIEEKRRTMRKQWPLWMLIFSQK